MTCLRLLTLLALPAFLFAESKTPSLGYTGAPTDHGGQSCIMCHNSYAVNDPAGSLQVIVSDYIPTESQTIRILVQHPQASRWGFQMTIREQSDETLSSGVFTVSDANEQVVCDNGTQYGSPAPCNSTMPRQFAEHMNAPMGTAGATYEFDVTWMPPDQEIGRLNVYVAAVAANDDGTAQGDWVYTNVTTLNNAGGCDFTKAPVLQTIVNGASFQPAFSSNGMISIFGTGFQTSGRSRGAGLGDFVNGAFPTELGCVGVQVTGPGLAQPVNLPIAFVDPTQINAQMPEFSGTGPIGLTVILNPGTMDAISSAVGTFNALQTYAPAFFLIPNSTTIAAEEAVTGTIVASPTLVPGAAPAKPGDIVSLFGTGFGDTNPPYTAGQLATGQAPITPAQPITVQIGGVTLASSDVMYAGLSPGSISGLYQFNVRIPATTANGDIPVTITIGGVSTPSATIPVQQ
ncbi:MAG TPA: choice-of-anchor V domain-containing protein [Bryobacteraceae bacterium]|nr:choice-of-anchor V domain-containing protein [Bryobacteraceae bacterium]